MDEGTYDGVQDSGDGKDDCNKVQGHRKGHVQFDGSHHALGKSNEMGKLFYFIVYMAIPTSACFRAGASLIPSPIIQTILFSC